VRGPPVAWRAYSLFGKHTLVSYAKPKASGAGPRVLMPLGALRRIALATPDFGSRWRLLLLVVAVTAIVATYLGVYNYDGLDNGYGDTDDATRLVAVRALLDGRGWWDQMVTRYQPPLGVWMHWSRLLDGGIAALDRLFRLGLSPDGAELATRFTWPMLWIIPAVWATLLSARRLGLGLLGNAAVLAAAVILVGDWSIYIQFRPGRIDHHDVQMTCAFLAMAGAMQRERKVAGAALAGVATALGTAVGLEGLLFSAAIGAMLALRFVFDRAAGRAAQAYGLGLALVTPALFALQTPPWRWGVEACDALALNLVAGLAVAGLGLAAAARFTARARWPVRLLAMAAVGGAAGAVYLLLDPHCRHGFFADVDPRIRPIWLNYVQEVRPIRIVLKKNLADGVGRIAIWSLGALCWLLIGLRRERRRDFAWWLNGLLIALGTAAGASAIRMTGYAEWFAIPAIAVAAVELVAWAGYRGWLAVGLAAVVAVPGVAQSAAETVTNRVAPFFAKPHPRSKAVPGRRGAKPARRPVDRCFDDDSFDRLADAEPPGIVLGEIDLGAYVIANTDDSALAAPYHRMSWGILRAHAILKAPADGPAADLARQAGVTYVLECRMHANHGDRADMTKDALQKRLDAGDPPAWLQPLSPPGAPLQAYRVLAPGAKAGPAPAPDKDGE
jgi:hypothetical protein